MILNYVIWDVNPDILNLGPLTIRWYGLLWALPFVIGYLVIGKMFKKENIKAELVDSLTMYVAIGAILGSRLGHCLFYEPEYYLSNPIEILKVWNGGLASHGGGIGIVLGIMLYAFKYKKSFLWLGDRLVIIVALAAFTIRTGNLMNSEIYGDATGSTNGFIYARYVSAPIKKSNIVEDVDFSKLESDQLIQDKYVPVEMDIEFKKRNYTDVELEHFVEKSVSRILANNGFTHEINFYHNVKVPIDYDIVDIDGIKHAKIRTAGIPHHPTQLYEGLSYLLLFFFLLGLYYKLKRIPNGLISGILLIMLFGARFIIEFIKQPQVAFEEGMKFNMGQWLSIPFILFGIVVLVFTFVKPNYSSVPVKNLVK